MTEVKAEKGWWLELDLDELREEFACLEEIECQNQAAVAEFGAHCAEKSTDGIYALGNMLHDARSELEAAKAEVRLANTVTEQLQRANKAHDEIQAKRLSLAAEALKWYAKNNFDDTGYKARKALEAIKEGK